MGHGPRKNTLHVGGSNIVFFTFFNMVGQGIVLTFPMDLDVCNLLQLD